MRENMKTLCIVGFLAFLLSAMPIFAGESHGLAMHGDLKYPADFKHFEYVNPDAPKGGDITLAAVGTFDSLNPFILRGNSAAGIGLIYETLTVNADDEPFSVYGLLAESIEVPKDGSWVAFTLREEARWHDGTSVTADDVIFSFEMLMSKKASPFYRMYYASVNEAVKINDRKVKFIFKKGEVNRELPLIMGQISIIQKKYFTEHEFDKTSLDFPVGSGPYRVLMLNAGRSITYERVTDYWGENIPVRKGTFNFDTITYEYYRDETVVVEAFKSGEYDFRMENTSKVWATAYEGKMFKKGYIIKEELPNGNPTGMQSFAFNIRRDLFKDKRVRLALTYLFDFEWTNEALFYGAYERTHSYFSNSELASYNLPSRSELKLLEPYRDQLPDEVFTTEYSSPTGGAKNMRNNFENAMTLLQEAGWVLDDKNRLMKDGKQFKFEILLVSPGFERISMPFRQNLEKVGIEMEIRLVDSSQYINRLNAFDFDMIVGSWGQSNSPGNEQRNMWGSYTANLSGSGNYIGIEDPVVDGLIEKVIHAKTREELITACRALDRVLLWGHYVIPHWHITVYRVSYWDMFGRPKVQPKYALGFIDTWWYDEAKASNVLKKR